MFSEYPQLYKQIFENANDAIILLKEGRFVECNNKTLELFGCERSQILEKSPQEFSPHYQPNGRPSSDLAQEKIQLALEGIPQRFEWIHLRLDGTEFVAEVSLKAMILHGESILHAIVRDRTEQRKMEDALEVSEKRWRSLVENLPDSVLLIDENMKILNLNHSAFGKPGDTQFNQGECLLEMVAMEYQSLARNAIEQAFQLGEMTLFLTQLQDEEKAFHEYEARVCPLEDENNKRTAIIIVSDVTERRRNERELQHHREDLENLVRERTLQLKLSEQHHKQAREEAERANKTKSEFISKMSHELRTPLNAILGFSQVLQLEYITSDQKQMVDEILQAGNHLLSLIEDILDLSRLEAGKLLVEIKPVSLLHNIKRALQYVYGMADRYQVTVVNNCDVDAMVMADSTRLNQILINLFSNAIKYNRKGGDVVVDVNRKAPGCIRVNVTDTGIGISNDKLEKLFTPFERLGVDKTRIEGLGIGLAYSKELAELMNMEIGVISTKGEGSTFWIDIPVSPA